MTDAQDRQDEARPRKGGFGAFSEQYRERWAVDHPKPKPAPDLGPATGEVADADRPGATSDGDGTQP
jgi:hypothetical protein